jgi:teichuronic acid exporter
MEVERHVAAGIKWSSLAKFGGQAISWSITLVVFRLLAPQDYGLMALGTVLIAIVSGVAEFGLGASLIQARALDERELSQVAGALAALNLACAVLMVAGAPLFAGMLANPRLIPVIQVLSVQFVLNALDAVPQSLAARQMKFKLIAGIDLATTLVSCLTTLLMALLGARVWALVIGNLAGAVLRTALYVGLAGFIRPSFGWTNMSRHVRFGGAVTLARLLWQLTYQADVLIAGRMLAAEAVGLYSVSMHLATLPMNKTMGMINQLAFPAVARLQLELPRMRERLLTSLRLLTLAGIPALWGISATAPEFVDVALGDRWHPAITALQIVSFVAPLRLLAAVLATALAALGRPDLELRNTVVGAIVLPVAFLLGARFGITGLAASWLAAMPIVFAINIPPTCRTLGIRFWQLIAAIRTPLIAGSVMYACVFAARLALVQYDELVRLPFLIVAGGSGYLGTISLLDRSIWGEVRRLAIAVRGQSV